MDKGDKSVNNNKMDSLKENCTKSKTKYRGKKRKRRDSDSSSEYEEMLSENALEMEKNLHASAVKNNLDEISVRKILKKVVTNDHVLALVKLREEELDSGPEENSLRPKLTRAKVKELMKVSPKAAAWNLENLELTPIKHIPVKTRPEVKALIAQELPEDEDDEEYEPTHEDVPSDDDQGLESCSDLDSQPRTPATPRSLHTASPKVVKDGPFKVPQDVSTPIRRKLDLEEEATIARRTRSKLSLSATSIEHIESTFVLPDEAPMPAVDDLWNQFLSECLNPAASSKHEDDDDADPEYNVAADPDAHDEDEEALGNSIIKISKKELNDLVTELFNIMPEAAADDDLAPDPPDAHEHSHAELSTRWEGKQEPVSDDEGKRKFSDRITFEKRGYSRLSIGKTEPSDSTQREADAGRNKKSEKNKEVNRAPPVNKPSRAVDIAIEEREEGEPGAGAKRVPPPLLQRHLKQARTTQRVTIKVDTGLTILPEQIAILQQQLRQHIQLAASNYLQLYIHPVHWSMAPPYKEYLETLSKLGASNSNSVVKVCNLQPALDLVHTWENTVSANTPENKEMVEFVQRESEKCRRRYSNKSLYVGEFHGTFQQVVANSSVFVYAHLLPPTPYRADAHKRYAYTRAEDELITLGLDQFWDYVENNPALYKPRPVSHPRHRWGLAVTLELVVKHMFPWIPFKVLLGHVQFVRKSNDKDNPIYKFFESRTVTPVRHKLLPYNPRLTLYEQPEHEVPRIWVRYLANTSKRFRQFLLRRTHTTGIAPQGIEVNLGQQVVEPTKAPLPIDFTKEIVSNRIDVRPKVPKPVLVDKFDIQIASTPTTSNSYRVTDLYRLVETSTAAYLMPLTNVTTTVNTNTTPISTPAEVTTQVPLDHVPECSNAAENPLRNEIAPLGNAEHCSCCIMLRRICKERQTTITEYFGRSKPMKSCYCQDIKYPKITNRLRILVSHFKSHSKNALQSIDATLKRKSQTKNEQDDISESDTFNMDDFVFAASFHLKLLTRTMVARDAQIKRRVCAALARFDAHAHAAESAHAPHTAVALARSVAGACATELVDVYKDFLAFLTPDQADACDAFRDYFVANCLHHLVNRIETQVQDAKLRCKLLRKLRNVFYNNLLSACQICTALLASLEGQPGLARHVFSLFPHRKETRCEPTVPSTLDCSPRCGEHPPSAQHVDAEHALRGRGDAAMDYEADHSSSEQEDASIPAQEYSQPDLIKNEITITENEIQTNHINQSLVISDVRHDSSDSSNNLMTIDEDPVKSETAEWKRDEDKLILEVLKEHLTPEERKDKTILEMIDEKDIINLIAASLTYKSKAEVTNRVLYLLQLLVLSEK